jgi:hypothetical protein
MGLRKWTIGAAEILVSVPDQWADKVRTLGGLLPSRPPGSSDPLDHSHADDPEVESDGTPEGQRL